MGGSRREGTALEEPLGREVTALEEQLGRDPPGEVEAPGVAVLLLLLRRC